MRRQLARIHLPEIKITVNGIPLDVGLSSIAVNTVDGVRDLRQTVKDELAKIDPKLIKKALVEALDGEKLSIELEDCNIDCPIDFTRSSQWNWEIGVSESTVQRATGRRIDIGYGSTLHNSLFKTKHQDNYTPASKTFDTLEELGFISSYGKVTREGERMLVQLSAIDISKETKRRLQFSRALLSTSREYTEAFNLAVRKEFIKFTTKHDRHREYWYVLDYRWSDPSRYPDAWYPTNEGFDWLVKHAAHILDHPECSRAKREKMIPYSPISYLVEYLTNDDKKLREPAIARFDSVIADSIC